MEKYQKALQVAVNIIKLLIAVLTFLLNITKK